MALKENSKVKIPEHCVKVPRNVTTYIQYTVRAYRNEKGKPTSERIAIGKLDAETGMLIPNRNYYEIFEKRDPDAAPVYALSYKSIKGKPTAEQSRPLGNVGVMFAKSQTV